MGCSYQVGESIRRTLYPGLVADLVPQKRQKISPENPNPLSFTEACEVFDSFANRSDLAWEEPLRGCFARAHVMCDEMLRRRTWPKKAWAYNVSCEEALLPNGLPFMINHLHVTLAVPVLMTDGSLKDLVIDPLLFDAPVTIDEWQQKLNANPEDVDVVPVGQKPKVKSVDHDYAPGISTFKLFLGKKGFWHPDIELAELQASIIKRQAFLNERLGYAAEFPRQLYPSRLFRKQFPSIKKRKGTDWETCKPMPWWKREPLPTKTVWPPPKPATFDEAIALFDELANRKDLASAWTDSGCEARCFVMAAAITNKGFEVWKAYVEKPLYSEVSPSAEIEHKEWQYHVAPLLYVTMPAGHIEPVVIDPALYDAPESFEAWQAKQRPRGAAEIVAFGKPPSFCNGDYTLNTKTADIMRNPAADSPWDTLRKNQGNLAQKGFPFLYVFPSKLFRKYNPECTARYGDNWSTIGAPKERNQIRFISQPKVETPAFG